MGYVAENGSPLIEVQGITKEFSGVRVLDHITFSISKGEIFGIIGENGAGKSTLIKIISGIYHPTEGALLFDGKKVTVRDAEVAQKMGINLIPQEFNLIPEMTVAENIFLGKEIQKRVFLDKSAMTEKTTALMRYLHSDISPYARIGSLSVAQKQMVEFAKALASESKLLILDEPTTVLTRKEIDILFEIMKKAKQTGVAMIYISHKLKEVKEICDKVMVLRDGKLISIEASDRFSVQDMATKMVGRELSQVFPPKAKPIEEVLLEVRNLSVPNCLEDITFALRKGEILGFAGLVGAGRTELAETLIGLRKRSAGVVVLNGKTLQVSSPTQAFDCGFAYLSEDRQGSGILTAFGIAENVTLSSLKRYGRVLLSKKKELAKAQEYVRKFDIKAASLKTRLEFFSGGNQQKVSFAKSLDADPQIILIDEPTRGIDVQAKHEMYRFIHSLVEGGLSCILISSEMEEIIGMSNRVVVMKEGRITGTLTGDQINEEEIMFYATGLKGVA